MIDVIIPVYNGHKYIDNCLASLVNQNIKNKLKVYIIDDGSKYGYSKIINKYNNNLYIQEIALKKHHNLAVARQKGIDISNSEYITFIDCDDSIPYKNSLEKMYNIMNNNKEIKIVSGSIILNKQKTSRRGAMWGKLYRRDLIDKYKIKCKYVYSNEDTMFSLKVLFMCHKNEYLEIDDIVYNYNRGINENSIIMTNKNRLKMISGIILSYKKAFALAKKYNYYHHVNKYTIDIFISLYLLIDGYKKDSINKLTEEELTKMINKTRNFYIKYKEYINLDFIDKGHQVLLTRFINELSI